MQHTADTHLLPFVLFFVICVWMVVSFLSSYTSGWASLARRYACSSGFSSDRWSFHSGHMRWTANYSNCLTIGANAEGTLSIHSFLLRIGHPALFTPWREVSVTRRKVLWFKRVQLHLGRELSIPLQISERLASKLKQSAGTSWPVESLT